MYESRMETLKQSIIDDGQTLILARSIQHRHTKDTIKTNINYLVYILTPNASIDLHRETNKAKALKTYKTTLTQLLTPVKNDIPNNVIYVDFVAKRRIAS